MKSISHNLKNATQNIKEELEQYRKIVSMSLIDLERADRQGIAKERLDRLQEMLEEEIEGLSK